MKQSINLLPSEKRSRLSSQWLLLIGGAWFALLIVIAMGLGLWNVYLGYQNAHIKEQIRLVSLQPVPEVDQELIRLSKQHDDMKTAILVAKQMNQYLQSKPLTRFSPLLASLAKAHVQGCWIESIKTKEGTQAFVLAGKAEHPKLVMAMLQNLKTQPKAIANLQLVAIHKLKENLYAFNLEGEHVQ